MNCEKERENGKRYFAACLCGSGLCGSDCLDLAAYSISDGLFRLDCGVYSSADNCCGFEDQQQAHQFRYENALDYADYGITCHGIVHVSAV